jgi:hypothetical protein
MSLGGGRCLGKESNVVESQMSVLFLTEVLSTMNVSSWKW